VRSGEPQRRATGAFSDRHENHRQVFCRISRHQHHASSTIAASARSSMAAIIGNDIRQKHAVLHF
jgi:hypothetical protein